MESSRTSLAALERAARKSVRPDRAGDAKTTQPPWWRQVVGVAIAVLAVTNIVTWRALVSERAARQEADQEQPRQAVQAQSKWATTASNWSALHPVAEDTVSGKTATTAVDAGTTSTNRNVANTTALGARLTKILTDPKAHEALRDQQKGGTLQLYGELLKRWHLSGQEATPVLDALSEHELKQFTSALSGEANAATTNVADEAAVQAALSRKQLEELRTYDASLPDRMTITLLLSQLQVEGTALPADRVDDLVNIMHEERVAVPPPESPSTPQPTSAYAEAMNEWQVALDQRVRERAALILSPDQLSRLEIFQDSQRAANSVFASLGPDTGQPAGTSSGHQ